MPMNEMGSAVNAFLFELLQREICCARSQEATTIYNVRQRTPRYPLVELWFSQSYLPVKYGIVRICLKHFQPWDELLF